MKDYKTNIGSLSLLLSLLMGIAGPTSLSAATTNLENEGDKENGASHWLRPDTLCVASSDLTTPEGGGFSPKSYTSPPPSSRKALSTHTTPESVASVAAGSPTTSPVSSPSRVPQQRTQSPHLTDVYKQLSAAALADPDGPPKVVRLGMSSCASDSSLPPESVTPTDAGKGVVSKFLFPPAASESAMASLPEGGEWGVSHESVVFRTMISAELLDQMPLLLSKCDKLLARLEESTSAVIPQQLKLLASVLKGADSWQGVLTDFAAAGGDILAFERIKAAMGSQNLYQLNAALVCFCAQTTCLSVISETEEDVFDYDHKLKMMLMALTYRISCLCSYEIFSPSSGWFGSLNDVWKAYKAGTESDILEVSKEDSILSAHRDKYAESVCLQEPGFRSDIKEKEGLGSLFRGIELSDLVTRYLAYTAEVRARRRAAIINRYNLMGIKNLEGVMPLGNAI